MIEQGCSDLPEVIVPASATLIEKLESLDASLKASWIEIQIIRVEFEQQIIKLHMKLQLETLPEVGA